MLCYMVTVKNWEWWNSVIRIPEMHFKLWKCKLLEGRDQLYLLLVSLASSVVHLAHSRHSINIYWLKQSCAQYPWDIYYDFCLNINLFFLFLKFLWKQYLYFKSLRIEIGLSRCPIFIRLAHYKLLVVRTPVWETSYIKTQMLKLWNVRTFDSCAMCCNILTP